jgi:hypothetical protein
MLFRQWKIFSVNRNRPTTPRRFRFMRRPRNERDIVNVNSCNYLLQQLFHIQQKFRLKSCLWFGCTHSFQVHISFLLTPSFFFEPDSLALTKFSKLCPEDTTVAFAIACIQAVYPERGVLLLVDELLKAQGPNPSQSNTVGVILTEIGRCLDTLSSAQFNAIVSSLDPRPFTSELTLS